MKNTKKEKEFYLAEGVSGVLTLKGREMAIVTEDISDPILGITLKHAYALKSNTLTWRSSLDASLIKTGNDYIYTDMFGKTHTFRELFYIKNQNGCRVATTDSAENLTVDSAGRLWRADGTEVFRDLRTKDGYRATTKLADVKNVHWLEQRMEAEMEAQEQLRSVEEYLTSFVVIPKTGDLVIRKPITLNIFDSHEKLMAFISQKFAAYDEETQTDIEIDSLLLNEAEAERYHVLWCDKLYLETLKDRDSQEEASYQSILEEISIYQGKDEGYRTALDKYGKEYKILKETVAAYAEAYPESFLYSKSGAMGFNRAGRLVTLQSENGKNLVITWEKHPASNQFVPVAITDTDENKLVLRYTEDGVLCEIQNSLGERTMFGTVSQSNKNFATILRPHLPLLNFIYSSSKDITQIDIGSYDRVTLSFANNHTCSGFVRSTTAKNIVHGKVTTNSAATEIENFGFENSINIYKIKNQKTNDFEAFQIDTEGNITEYTTQSRDAVTSQRKYTYENGLLIKIEHAAPCCLYKKPLESFVAGDTEEYEYNEFFDVQKTVSKSYPHQGQSAGTKKEALTLIHFNENGDPTEIYTNKTENFEGESAPVKTELSEKYFYDSFGRLVRKESKNVTKEHLFGTDVEEIFYDENGREASHVSYNSYAPSDKFYTENKYDENGRVCEMLDGTGRQKTHYAYVGDTDILREEKNTSGSTRAYAYDKEERLVSVTVSTEDGEANTSDTYYTADVPICHVSANHVLNYTYDGKRRLTALNIDGWPYVDVTYAEDETTGDETQTFRHTDFASVPTVTVCDTRGRLLSHALGSLANVTYRYDAKGNLTKETDSFSGREKTFEYDDEKDRLTTYTDSRGVSETCTYDNRDRISEKTDTVGEAAITTVYHYDEDMEHLSSVNIGGVDVVRLHDPLRRCIGRSLWRMGSFLHKEVTNFLKYGDHATSLPSLLKLSSASDSLYIGYTYDAAGNIAQIKENGIVTARYEYDSLGRLTREDNRPLGKTVLFAYDKNGNILSMGEYAFTLKDTKYLVEDKPVNCTTYGYAGDYMLWKNGEKRFTFGYNGYPTLYDGKEVSWRAPGQPSSFNGVSVAYDADGLCSSIGNDSFLRDRQGKIVKDSALRYVYGEDGRLFCCITDEGARYYYRHDALGNVISLLDNTGTVVVKYVYDAWGCYKILSPDGTEITDGAHIGKKNPFRYRGYYYSEALKLYALAARFYDPKIGRFICADTIDYLDPESPNGLNLFAYCNNNPVMYSDPSGHSVLATLLLFVAGAVFGFGASASASAIVQYETTGEIDIGKILYDGAFGAINGVLATTGITWLGSALVGLGLGVVSSIGEDIIFNDGNINLGNALTSGVLGFVAGFISGPGAKVDIANLTHSQTILNNTIANETVRAIPHQRLVRNKHLWSVVWDGIGGFFNNFVSTYISRSGVLSE